MSIGVTEIEAIRDSAAAQLQSLLASSAPTITVNGTEVPWTPFLSALQGTLDWCDRKLQEYEPYEVRSQGKS